MFYFYLILIVSWYKRSKWHACIRVYELHTYAVIPVLFLCIFSTCKIGPIRQRLPSSLLQKQKLSTIPLNQTKTVACSDVMATEKITILQKNLLCFTHLTCMLCMQRMGSLISLCFISLLEIVLCKCPFSLNEWMEEFCENINNIMSRKINFKSREMTLD